MSTDHFCTGIVLAPLRLDKIHDYGIDHWLAMIKKVSDLQESKKRHALDGGAACSCSFCCALTLLLDV